MENSMKLTVKAITKNEVFVRNTIAAFCVDSNPSIETIGDIKTAVSEAISNCIIHAYKQKDGEINITAEISDNTLHIEISDNGCGIEDVEKAMNPHFSTEQASERAGIGFTIMDAFMDSLKVVSDKNGTTVSMNKKLA